MMKRDMSLIVKILLMLEKNQSQDNQLIIDTLQSENYDKKKIYYHIYLAYQAGLIEGYKNVQEKDGYFYNWKFPAIIPTIITWEGHNLIDEVQQKSVETINKLSENIEVTQQYHLNLPSES